MAQFDVSKPSFDLLCLRSVRGDALIRYNALNQSEPLRIVLGALGVFGGIIAPSLTAVVGYDDLSLPVQGMSYVTALASAAWLIQECQSRNQQLIRMEKEFMTESLPIRLPAASVLADRPWTAPTTLSTLRSLSTPPRIIAICGTAERLTKALEELSVLGRRWTQASVYVVPICTDPNATKTSDYWKTSSSGSSYVPWLADCYEPETWTSYFASLSANGKDDSGTTSSSSSFQWFGLNASGRSFGSGSDEMPQWIQLLGQHLRPTTLLSPTDESRSSDDEASESAKLLASLDRFYQALTTGNEADMEGVFGMSKVDDPSSFASPQVTEVINGGGRLDTWKDCLAEGARPTGMKTSGADVVLLSPTRAYTSMIEFPSNTGMETGATLLALQSWTRQNEDDEWRLDLHQTIPWSPEAKAQGTLRCDCRGCVALTRSPERRTFGGLIG